MATIKPTIQNNRTHQVNKVFFEVTNACNFRCDFCPINHSSRPARQMDFSLLIKGIAEVANYRIANSIGFHVLGEPLLYTRLPDAIRYAAGMGLNTEVTTNGSLLDEKRVRELVDSGLDTLSISLQMLDEHDHQCRGTTIPFEDYYQTIMDAVRLVNRLNGRTRVVLVSMNPWTKRIFDIDDPMQIRWDVKAFREKLSRVLADVYPAAGIPMERQEIDRALTSKNLYKAWNLALNDRTSISILPLVDWGNAFTSRPVHPARFGFCGYALKTVGVLNDGRVTVCCADFGGKTALGNLNSSPLASLLSSEPAQQIRDGFDKMKITHPYCRRCIGSTNPVKAVVKGVLSIGLFKLASFSPGGKLTEKTLFPDGLNLSPVDGG